MKIFLETKRKKVNKVFVSEVLQVEGIDKDYIIEGSTIVFNFNAAMETVIQVTFINSTIAEYIIVRGKALDYRYN